jgi:hypothetical protein
MTFLAMFATLCLPRQFQMMVVENVDERQERVGRDLPRVLLILHVEDGAVKGGTLQLNFWCSLQSIL